MTDKIARFVSERWEPVSQFGGNELGDVHRETLQELGECAAEVDALRAQIAFLTIQRDAAEALAREAQTARDCAESYTKSVTAERNHLLDEVERVGKIADQADAVVASVVASSPIAGRWCLASERDEAQREAADSDAEYGKALARAEKAEARIERMESVARQIVAISHGNGGVHGLGNSDVEEAVTRMTMRHIDTVHKLESAERRESELGVQVVAQAARLRLADGVVEVLRVFVDEDNWQTCPHCCGEGTNPDDHKGETRCPVCCGGLQSYRDDRADCAETSITDAMAALAAWDAVPGDVGTP